MADPAPPTAKAETLPSMQGSRNPPLFCTHPGCSARIKVCAGCTLAFELGQEIHHRTDGARVGGGHCCVLCAPAPAPAHAPGHQ